MENYSRDDLRRNKKYLELLSNDFPSITRTVSELVNLQAILNLPKGTEHFLTDIHGEDKAFNHVLQNGSGAVRKKVLEALEHTTTMEDLDDLTGLIYYPAEKLEMVKKSKPKRYLNNWYELTIYRLVRVCREAASKYTRSKVSKALPKDFAYIMGELLQEDESRTDKKDYYNSIISVLVESGRADLFIIELSDLIKRFVIDHLHIIGDIFDRGPGPQIVMDQLMEHHSMDIQWGNHDILWMGAAAGNTACIANVIRIALRYSIMDVLETGYGINLLPLASFAGRAYKDDVCPQFKPRGLDDDNWQANPDNTLMAKMHKAISIIQFKLEDQIITNNPNFNMDDRRQLRMIDYDNGSITLDGVVYALNDNNFPTVDPEQPWALTEEEQSVIDKLVSAFKKSEKLQKHVRFLYAKGSMYLTFNGNLLFHACQLMEPDVSFSELKIDGKYYSGRALMDKYDQMAREAYFSSEDTYSSITDFLWFLWCNKNSPLFGKDKMATFERYFIDDKATHKENYNTYYQLINSEEHGEETARAILKEFGIDPDKGHMINGHVPVKTIKGESPIRANGKQLVIDGGFANAYHEATGIAGYTLTFNSYGLLLISHKPFTSIEEALSENCDFREEKREVVESSFDRMTVRDTDTGMAIRDQVKDLEMLLTAYRRGIVKEKVLE